MTQRNYDELITALKDKKELVRADAARELGEIQAVEAVPYLVNALKVESRKRARLDMYYALVILGRETDLAPLLHLLKAKPVATREAAAHRLIGLVNDSNQEVIMGALVNALEKEPDDHIKQILNSGIDKIKKKV